MSFEFPVDKLGVINSALSATGDNLVNVADDGSDEWNVCSPAYERALGYIIDGHSWGYATQVVTLQPSPTAPQDTDWDTAYPIPADCVHILWLKINQDTSDPITQTTAQLTLYDIMGTPTGPVIVCNAQGGPPPPPPNTVTPATITLRYVSNKGALADSTSGTPTLNTQGTTLVLGNAVPGHIAEPFVGSLDDVLIYDRVLTPAEVLAVYQQPL